MNPIIEDCPPEIWALIFTYACTDTGFTGRSLSACCSYLREVSRPYKFLSLCIDGAKDAPALALTIARGEWVPGVQPVHHLLVTWDDRDPEKNREFMEPSLQEIITLNAPYLRSLVLFAPSLFVVPAQPIAIPPLVFTHLHHLSVFSGSTDTFFMLSQLLSREDGDAVHIDGLAGLHIDSNATTNNNVNSEDRGVNAAPVFSTVAFPSLKHIRLRCRVGLANARLYTCLAHSAPSLESIKLNQTTLRDAETFRVNLTTAFGFRWPGVLDASSVDGPGNTGSSESQSQAQNDQLVDGYRRLRSGGVDGSGDVARPCPDVVVEMMGEPKHPIQTSAWQMDVARLGVMQRANKRFRVVEKGKMPPYESAEGAWLEGYWF